MTEREKLFLIDEIRLTDIFLLLEQVRGKYTARIERDLDNIEDSVNNVINKYRSNEYCLSDLGYEDQKYEESEK